MPETGDDQVPNQPKTKKRNERTEAKFFEDVEKLIAQIDALGADYNPPNEIAKAVNLKAKRDATVAARTANQANIAAEETKRNQRENLYKSLNGDVTKLVDYAKAAGKPVNDIEALKAISRDIKGQRAKAVTPNENGEGNSSVSVANLSYVTRADNYSRFIEQYDTLAITTDEDMYKASTHRTKQAALRQSNSDVIEAESGSNTSSESLDKLAYTDADSLVNSCIAAKTYILSKYGKTGQPYKNIAKTRFIMPQRLK